MMVGRISPTGKIATVGLFVLALLAVLGLSPPQAAHAQTAEIQIPLTVSTDNDRSQELTIGLDPDATDGVDSELNEVQQPPFPPGFDARLIDDHISASGFGEGLIDDFRQGSARFTGTKTHEISFQTNDSATEVTISWDLPDGVTGTIEDRFDGSVYGPVDMTGNGSLTLNPTDPEAIVTLEYEGNEAPTIGTNAGLTLETDESSKITTAELDAADPDDPASALTYTVTDAPTQGTLLVDGSSASSFTQAELESGAVEYQHTASSTENDSFTFDLSDSVGPGPTGQTFQITVESPVHEVVINGTDGTGNDTGWRLLAPPSSATRSDLEDDLDFTVDSGTLLHTWDAQWVPATSSSTSLPRGKGFILYFFDDNTDPIPADGLTLDVPDGGENQTEDVTVDGLNQNNDYHLLGNPYDVAFDLGHLAGGDLPGNGFQNTVQIWDPSGGGQWMAITQGETDDNVAAWQGFFVERAPGGEQTSLTFNAKGRQSGPGSLVGNKTQRPSTAAEEQAQVELALSVEHNGDTIAQEGITLLFHEEAETGWDAYEASQLPPPSGGAYATVNSPLLRDGDFVRRALASEPFPAGSTPITSPLSVQSVGAAGTATLRWPESKRGALSPGWDVKLIDTATGTTVDLRNGAYAFELEAGDGTIAAPDDARFDLRVMPPQMSVELTGLGGEHKGEAVRLTWQTDSETDNDVFYVQRKRDDAPWQQVGFVESKAEDGTTSESKQYRFRDADLPYAADSLLYRLRQVDADGTAHLSEKTVVRLAPSEQLTLRAPLPNPVRQQATLRFETPEPMEVQVAVYDLLGRQVATLVDGRLDAGRHTEQFSASSLAPGMYFVRLRAGDRTQTRKLTVVR